MGDGPPIALKIGSFNCFCLWDGASSGEFQIEHPLENRHVRGLVSGSVPEDRTGAPSDAVQTKHVAAVGSGGCGGSGNPTPSSGAPAANGVVTSASVGGGAHISRNSVEVRNVNHVDHPLMAAVRLQSGNVASVDRELSLVDGSNISWDVDASVHERLRRVVTQHRSAAHSAEWHVRETSLGSGGLEFGARVVDGMSQWFRCAEFRGCDVVKGFAAFLEVDLVGGFSESVVAAEPLGVHTAKRDATWRVIGKTSSANAHDAMKQQSVWSYGALDALDEPIGALVVFAHTPPEHRLPGSGGLSQQRRGGAMDFDCAIHCFEPLWPEKGEPGSRAGFRLRQTGVSKLAAFGTSPATSTEAQGDLPQHELFHARLTKFLCFARQLDERMRMSPRTDLYERVRRHIRRLAPETYEVEAPIPRLRMPSTEYGSVTIGAI
eukprot:TRINITY_DN12095_c0_g8_i1.p1 TRINITY_DN12095_c0_g8~~TRINITY_DN12095_c0_g8_i1.p1  ORF type:complete len:434 (-),score=63.27 TRINITY_DN12095_c0_g8_i1:39-1340(-)